MSRILSGTVVAQEVDKEQKIQRPEERREEKTSSLPILAGN
jgi:hypothetical protein